MARQRQHGVIQIDICLKMIQDYKKKKRTEKGSQITYDIQAMREDPRKLSRWLQQGEVPTYSDTENATQMWGNVKNTYTKRITTQLPHKNIIKTTNTRLVKRSKKMGHIKRTGRLANTPRKGNNCKQQLPDWAAKQKLPKTYPLIQTTQCVAKSDAIHPAK